MPLSPDLLIDRINLKKSIFKWKFFALLSLVITLAVISFKNASPINQSYIARVTIDKELQENIKHERTLRSLAVNPNVKAVIIHINSPGGTEVASEDLYQAVKSISQVKPVVTTLGTIAASGGYMVAIAADHIIARHSTITGSIGVIMQSGEITELAKKIGINMFSFKSSKFKAAPSPFEALSPDVIKAIDETLFDNYVLFKDLVAKERNLSTDQLSKVADGRIFSGNQALSLNLIDELGGEEEAKDWLNKQNIVNLPIKDIELNKRSDVLYNLMTKLKAEAYGLFNNYFSSPSFIPSLKL